MITKSELEKLLASTETYRVERTKSTRGPLHVQLRSALDYIRNRFLAKRYSSTMIDQRLADSGTTPIAPLKRFLQTPSITSHIELRNPLPSW